MDASSGAPAAVSTTLAEWFATPLGHYLLAREQAWFDRTIADIFGFHAIQVGLPEYPFLAQSRIAARWTVDAAPPAQVLADPLLAAVSREFARSRRAAARARVQRRPASAAARGPSHGAPGRPARDRRLQSVLAVRRAPLFRPRRDAAVERQLHRALPAEGLARAARLRGHGRRARRLRAAVRAGKVAVALRLLRKRGRPLVADRRRRLLPARDEARARHARDHAGVGTAQERARDRAAAGAGDASSGSDQP